MAGRVDSKASSTDETGSRLALSAADRLPILAVDDRPENLVALEAVLGPLGFEVVAAASGEEALRLLLERDFALILLDVRMPGLGGLETARLIKSRERSREVPIVFLTAARDEVGDIVRGYGVGAVDYVLKPFDPDLLRSKVAVFAELEHSRRALRHSEAFLRSAFDAAPIGKTVLDVGRRIVRANPAFARMVGRTQESLNGVAITELFDPEDRAAFSTVLDRVAGDHESDPAAGHGLGFDLRLTSGSGRGVWVAPTASWIEPSDLTIPLLLVQWVDVNARRRSEQTRAELLLEQAARTQAEAQAERLEKLQRLVEAIESPSLDDTLAELARRLVGLFDADVAEVQVDGGVDDPAILRASAAHLQRPDAGIADTEIERWQEAALNADGVAIGALRVAVARERVFTTSEQVLLRDAADRVSLVVRRAQLHEREHRIAVELQRGLLPRQLPEVSDVEIAAHYQAAGLGTEVGGDWYDAFSLSGGRLGLVIGDVTGSGIRAASAMGQLRSVTRALAFGDAAPPSPAEVLTRLNRYHQMLGFEELFTVLYMILDPSRSTAVWANAGHPPPLLRKRSGEVRTLDGVESMMCLDDVVYKDRQTKVDEGDTLILYTDGLIERRGEAIDAGVQRLAAAVGAGPEEPDALCAHALASAPAQDAQPEDDLTALVVRLSPRESHAAKDTFAGAPIEATVAPDANAPAAARRLIEQSFGDSVDPDELDRARLVISELATNAVRHGRGEITLRANLNPERLFVEVIDQGAGFERVVREPEFERVGGWGLSIVDAQTSRSGITGPPTRVWFEIDRRRDRFEASRIISADEPRAANPRAAPVSRTDRSGTP